MTVVLGFGALVDVTDRAVRPPQAEDEIEVGAAGQDALQRCAHHRQIVGLHHLEEALHVGGSLLWR